MLKKHILFFVLIIGLVSLYYLLGITCPFIFLFKIPCPTCGMTRSAISLLKLDFQGYIYCNAFTVPVVLASLIIIHSNVLKAPWKKPALTLSLIILIANFIYYFHRLFIFLNQ